MESQNAIASLCQELVACVTKILDPLSAQAERAVCNQVTEAVPINEQLNKITVLRQVKSLPALANTVFMFTGSIVLRCPIQGM